MVVRPGYHQIPVNSTIQGAIAQAGGLQPGANLRSIKIIRNQNGKSNNETVNLEEFLIHGNPN